MKKYYYLEIYHHGDDWEHIESKTIHDTLEEAEAYLNKHRSEHENINGIEWIEGCIDDLTKEQLKDYLTYREYVKKFGN